eukprot:9388161-Ditylum_brightwellii.AAC.3
MLKNNIKETKSRIEHIYKVGNKVLIVKLRDQISTDPKLSKPTESPYTINRVHRNGTVTIDRGQYEERIHIRRLKPYNE